MLGRSTLRFTPGLSLRLAALYLHRMRYVLRQATTSDSEFVYQVTEASMREYVEHTFGPWVTEEQRNIIGKSFDPSTHQVISVAGKTAGILAIRSHENYVQLEKLYLLPEFQRLGIGSDILEKLTNSARRARTPIHLRVLSSNTGALKLYERLGFVVVDEVPERKFMEYHT